MSTRLLFWHGAVLWACWPALAAAQAPMPCALVNKGATVVLGPSAKPLVLPDVEHANCVGLKVTQGLVVACVSGGASATSGHCRSYKAPQTIDAESLGRAGAAPGTAATLVAMLKGGAGSAFAISRSGEALPPLPTGVAAALQPRLSVDFAGHPGLQGAQAVEVRAGGTDGPLVATLTPASPHLATEALQAGQRYAWRVRTDQPGLPLLGRFSLLTAEQRAAGAAEQARIAQAAPGDAEAQAVLWAGWLHGQGARHEAAQVLQAAGIGAP